MVDMAHFAGLVAAGLHPSPVPHAHVVTSTTHKTLGGPRGGVILTTAELAKKFNSAVFPGQQGGPLEHVIAAKAVSFKLAAEPEFRERQERTLGAPGSSPTGCWPTTPRGRHRRAQRRHRRAPGAGRPARLGARRPAGARTACTRSGSRSTATPCPSTRARRWSAPAADRHPGAGHPRLRRRGVRRGRRHHRPGPAARARRRRDGPAAGPGRRPRRPPPALPDLRRRPDEPAHPRLPTCPSTPTSSGATRSRSAPTTSSSSAAAGTAWPRRTTWPRTTASPTSRCWRRAGWPAATWPATPRSSAPTTSGTRARPSTSTRSSCGRASRTTSTTRSCSASAGCSTSRTRLQDVRDSVRRVEANKLNGVDAEWVDADEVKKICPIVNTSTDIRYPVLGATYQPRAGIAKHDYVAWGFARRAERGRRRPHPGLRGHRLHHRRRPGHRGADHPRGHRRRPGRCCAPRGTPRVLAEMVGIRVPIQSHPLQALVSELLEPVHPTVVMSNAVHVYVSQAHKGELVMGAGVDTYNGYGQRGAFHIIERQMAAAVELFPVFARAHLLRTWGGIVDVTPDASPIVGLTPFENLYLNCGWGTGGFKATPGVGWCFADTDRPRRAAPVHRAVRARPLRHRRARRRARRRRRGPLRQEPPMQLIAMPVLRPPRRGRVPLRRPGPRRLPAGPGRPVRRGVGALPLLPRQPQGPVRRAVDPQPRLPPVVQRRPRHRHLPIRGRLPPRRAEPVTP